MLHLYNSLTRQKEPLQPITPNQIRLYVCGMTVYDYCHVGHARVMVVFDSLVRYLRALNYQVIYVRNITDIDDKIIQRAQKNGESMNALTTRFIEAMHTDFDALQILRPDHEPRATDSIPEIINLIQTLIQKGFAYTAANGDVYYAVRRFQNYGKLSGKQLADLQAGARVEIGELKQDPLDFALWKSAKEDEPSWQSPWGAGRPGWHIECSAMSTTCLGNHFDIHGGGMDLQFPHHENEIAQSEAATGEKYVNLWMHNGFVQVNEEKMSKSLGNFFTLRDVLARYDAETIRYFILASHYRSPLNYADSQLDAAHQSLNRLYTALRGIPLNPTPPAITPQTSAYSTRFFTAMNDDLNTSEAIAVLFELARDINIARNQSASLETATHLATELKQLAAILGLLHSDPDTYLQSGTTHTLSNSAVEALIAERQAARQRKDWQASDRLRDELKAHDIILEDNPTGTTWRRG